MDGSQGKSAWKTTLLGVEGQVLCMGENPVI